MTTKQRRGSLYKRGRTWTYSFEVRRNGKRRVASKGGFRVKADAEKALRDALGRHERGGPVTPARVTLGDYVRDTWLPPMRSQVKPSTFKSYADALEGRVLPRIGDVRLAEITPKAVEDLKEDLLAHGGRGATPDRSGGPLSARTVRYTLRILRQVLAYAVENGDLARNPAAVVKPPKVEDREMNAWTPEQARAFLDDVADDRLSGLWSLLLATGLRRGEALGLRWDDVDLDARRLSVKRTLVNVGYEVRWSEPKTRKSRRTIALSLHAVDVLRAHRARQREERLAAGPAWNDDGLVFCDGLGAPLNPSNVSQRFDNLVARVDVPTIRLHDLRHSAASVALAEGVPLKVVSEMLGHSSTAITADVYMHVDGEMQDDAAARVGAAIFGVPRV